MSDPSSRAVFLSYASQDKEVALRVCEALRASGVEVWFDQSELRGGDSWDAKIRRQIKECALFVPLITANTNARPEGYFRLEWKLAVDRSHLMADDAPFLFPIIVGDVAEPTARVPEKFREVQWTRLRLDETPAELGVRVARLLSGNPTDNRQLTTDNRAGRSRHARWQWWMIFPIIGTIMGLMFAAVPMWKAMNRPPSKQPTQTPDPKSQTQPLSEARQLLARARAMSLEKYDSSIDDFTAAEGLIKRALELEPNDAEIWAASSLINFSFNSRGFERTPARNAAARAHAERALKLAPDSIEALFALGRWQRDNEDPGLAEATLLKVLARNPDHSGALHNLGYLYDRMDRLDEAAALYAREAKNPAAAPLAGFTEYLMYFRRGRFEEADRAVRKSIAAEPSANSQSGLAMLLLTWKGDVEAAAAAVASGPATIRREHRPIWITTLVHLCRRKPDEALRVLDRLPDEYILDNWYTGPKNYFVGLIHAQAGRESAARVAWEAGLALVDERLRGNPADFQLRLARGELLALLGREAEALAEVRTIEQLGQRDEAWIYTPVKIYAALGRADEAIRLIESRLQYAREHRNLGWHLTPALLRIDPRWDKIRGDPRFRKLTEDPSPAAVSPARELADKALALIDGLEVTREGLALAEDYCERAVKLDSSDGEVCAIYAQVHGAYVYRGWDNSPARKEQNRVMAERAMLLAPKSVQARIAQAGAWSTFSINRPETEKLLREVVAEQPGNQFALRFLAVTLLGRGELAECLAINERSAALPGGDPLALYNNSRYLLQAGREEEAYATMERSLAQKPFSSSLVMKTLMEIYRKGDLAAAEATQKRIPAAVLLEDRANYISGLLRYYRRDAEGALQTWGAFPREAYADFQFDSPKGLLIGFAYELDGREAAAKIEWRTALLLADRRLAAASNNPRRHYDRAYLLACLGEKEAAGEALRTYEQLAGIKLGPGRPMTFELALVYARLGRFDELLAHWPASAVVRVRLDPRFDQVRADPRFVQVSK
jgi:tetratricopeptide (TPR) repeat protein